MEAWSHSLARLPAAFHADRDELLALMRKEAILYQSCGSCGRPWRSAATATHSRNNGCQRSSEDAWESVMLDQTTEY